MTRIHILFTPSQVHGLSEYVLGHIVSEVFGGAEKLTKCIIIREKKKLETSTSSKNVYENV